MGQLRGQLRPIRTLPDKDRSSREDISIWLIRAAPNARNVSSQQAVIKMAEVVIIVGQEDEEIGLVSLQEALKSRFQEVREADQLVDPVREPILATRL